MNYHGKLDLVNRVRDECSFRFLKFRASSLSSCWESLEDQPSFHCGESNGTRRKD